MTVNIYYGDTLLEDLSVEEQKRISNKISQIYADQVLNRLMNLINSGDAAGAEKYYNEITKCIVT